MLDFQLVMGWSLRWRPSNTTKEKADVAEHPRAFDHVGLLINGIPSTGWAALYLVIRLFCRPGLVPARQAAELYPFGLNNANSGCEAFRHLLPSRLCVPPAHHLQQQRRPQAAEDHLVRTGP